MPLDTSADPVVVYGSVASGGHTWTVSEHRAVNALARAIVFTAIDTLRDAGWETEFESAPLAAHDWAAIDDEVDRILRTHTAVPSAEIEAALATLSRRGTGPGN